jgi:hypothetical protein
MTRKLTTQEIVDIKSGSIKNLTLPNPLRPRLAKFCKAPMSLWKKRGHLIKPWHTRMRIMEWEI